MEIWHGHWCWHKWHINFTLKPKDTLNIQSSILSRLRIHKHAFTTEASFSLAYTITLTSSPLPHISFRPYIHRRVKCIDTRKQRLKINFYVGFWILTIFEMLSGQIFFLQLSVLLWTVINLPDLP